MIESLFGLLFQCLLSFALQDENTVPLSTKLKALELLDMADRAAEEIKRVASDIRCSLLYYTKQHATLISSIPSTKDNRAERAGLFEKLFNVECLIVELLNISNGCCDGVIRTSDFTFQHNTLCGVLDVDDDCDPSFDDAGVVDSDLDEDDSDNDCNTDLVEQFVLND